MGLSNLPAVVLDVLVEFAGYEQGWRLEIASQSLKAASMECAAIRLGKCRWVGGDREDVAFKPSWRHVAAATRRGPYFALTAETAADTSFQVDHWELVPAMLAADERFEWRVPESPTMPNERLPHPRDLYGEPHDTDEDEH